MFILMLHFQIDTTRNKVTFRHSYYNKHYHELHNHQWINKQVPYFLELKI